ncbi:Ribosome-binding protein 1 [Babesia ovata]|uniref:Ribosome-binding protein 1 n=1 Tax=Babesia ovata TaxID=189622 RepID=A0A2H6KB63_9APIC|nr:Ribosome-binding protein 1 [Babesia ovata]GBE60230.1 Ribosome-binding protein 1 [Babesia ovata]
MTAHGVPLNTLKDCLQFLQWLHKDSGKQGEVTDALFKRIATYYNNSTFKGQLQLSLPNFLRHTSLLYGQICNEINKNYSSYQSLDAQHITDAFSECLPKVHAAFSYLVYNVDHSYRNVGGGTWGNFETQGDESIGNALRGYLTSSDSSITGGINPGGFLPSDLKNVLGKTLAHNLNNALHRTTITPDVFTSVLFNNLVKDDWHDLDAGNVLLLLWAFCDYVEHEREDGALGKKLKEELRRKKMCFDWDALVRHCETLKGELDKLFGSAVDDFSPKPFSTTGRAFTPFALKPDAFAGAFEKWFEKHWQRITEALEDIKEGVDDFAESPESFTPENIYPYGIVLNQHKRNAWEQGLKILPSVLETLVGSRKGLEELKDILNGTVCPVTPPKEVVPEKKVPKVPPAQTEAAKPVVTKAEAAKPTATEGTEGAQNQGKEAEGAQNQGKGLSGDASSGSASGKPAAAPPPGAPGVQGPQGPTVTVSTAQDQAGKNSISPGPPGPGAKPSSPDQDTAVPPLVPPPPPPSPPLPGGPGQQGDPGQSSPGNASPGQKPVSPKVTVVTQPPSVSGSGAGTTGDKGPGTPGGGGAGQQITQRTSHDSGQTPSGNTTTSGASQPGGGAGGSGSGCSNPIKLPPEFGGGSYCPRNGKTWDSTARRQMHDEWDKKAQEANQRVAERRRQREERLRQQREAEERRRQDAEERKKLNEIRSQHSIVPGTDYHDNFGGKSPKKRAHKKAAAPISHDLKVPMLEGSGIPLPPLGGGVLDGLVGEVLPDNSIKVEDQKLMDIHDAERKIHSNIAQRERELQELKLISMYVDEERKRDIEAAQKEVQHVKFLEGVQKDVILRGEITDFPFTGETVPDTTDILRDRERELKAQSDLAKMYEAHKQREYDRELSAYFNKVMKGRDAYQPEGITVDATPISSLIRQSSDHLDVDVYVPKLALQDSSYDVNVGYDPPTIPEVQLLDPIVPSTTAADLSFEHQAYRPPSPRTDFDTKNINRPNVPMCIPDWSTQKPTHDSTDIPDTELFPSEAPRTVREMLTWIAGLRHPKHQETLKQCIKNAFKRGDDDSAILQLPVNDSSIAAKDVLHTIKLVAMFAASVLNALAPEWRMAVPSLTSASKVSDQSKDPDCCALLCQLRDYVYACYHQLEFLKSQCSRKESDSGWQDCQYGNNIPDSPLQAFLTDAHDSKFETHPFDPCDICLKSRIRMGFTKDDLPASHETGKHISAILSPSCGGDDPLLKLSSYLSCLTRRTPRTTGELVSFFHLFGNELHLPSSHFSPLGSALHKPHPHCPEWDCLEAADLNAIQDLRGSATLNSNSNHEKDHPKTLSTLLGCGIDNVNCTRLLSPITHRAYALYSPAFAHHYLSWTAYLADRLSESLHRLHHDLEDLQCHDSNSKPLHQCPKSLPLLYSHGFTPPGGMLQPSLTCSKVITKLEEVVAGKPIADLITAMDTFLYGIRTPFVYTIVTLWLIATLYIAHSLLYRMDVLRIRSHLLTTRASHLIDVKALLAGSRRMLSLYKDVDYFDEDVIAQFGVTQ